jgi:hypothetical protein
LSRTKKLDTPSTAFPNKLISPGAPTTKLYIVHPIASFTSLFLDAASLFFGEILT